MSEECTTNDWVKVTLGELCEINPPKISLHADTEVTFLGMADVSENAKIANQKVTKYQKVKSGFTAFKECDILVAKITPCFENGKGAKAYRLKNGIGFGSTEFHVLRPKKDVCNDLIYYHTVSQKFRSNGTARMTGSAGQQRVPKEFLNSYEIYFPENPKEQKTISSILETIDQSIEKTEHLIAKYERIKNGLMQDLLTRGIDEEGNIRSEETHAFKVSDFNDIRIPTEWNFCRMKDVSVVNQGLQIAIKNRKEMPGEGGFVYITIQYLNNPNNNIEYIENPPSSVIAQKDDIIFTRTGNTGQVVTNVEGVFHNNFFKVSYDRAKVRRDYLVYYLRWEPIQTLIKDIAGTTTIPDLKHSDFYNLPFFLPKIEEQDRIIAMMTSVQKIISKENSMLKNLKNQKKGLMQDLLTGKVRVDALMQKEKALQTI